MLLTCTCTSVSLSACRYSASFYNNSFFDVGTRLNHCFITNYSKLLLLLHVHVHIFPYNLDYFRYIISFLSFHCAYCAKCSWLWCCPFAFKGFKESRYHGIHDVIMCWFLRKEKNGLNFVVLKDVPDIYQLKLSLHWKNFFALEGFLTKCDFT